MRFAMREVFNFDSGIDHHEFGGKTDWLSLLEMMIPHGYSAADIEAAMPTYDRAMAHHLGRVIGDFDVQPCPAALELVADLHERAETMLAVVTGNVSGSAPIKLRAAGFDTNLFPIGAYGNEAINRDDLPPLALARAVEHYRQPIAPAQVIVVGDTPADVACARALGAVAVAVRTGFCKPGELEASAPDYLLDDLTSFDDVLAALA
jgi:phosphoglycolate phosphatase-like HAD superfamily hydrolase